LYKLNERRIEMEGAKYSYSPRNDCISTAPSKEPQVSSSIGQTSMAIDSLEVVIKDLEDRLTIVLMPAPPAPQYKDEGKVPPARVELSSRIYQLKDRIDLCHDRISYIITRLEL
jgi:hypothetical protein